MSTFIKQTLFGLAIVFVVFFGILPMLGTEIVGIVITVLAALKIGDWCQKIAEKVFPE